MGEQVTVKIITKDAVSAAVEQGYLEGKYRNKDEQDFASKNDHEWYTILAFERDVATHQLGQMAADRTSRVNCRIAELRYNFNFDIENAAYKAQKEIVEEFELYVFIAHLNFIHLQEIEKESLQYP
jgi:hypothetical protein